MAEGTRRRRSQRDARRLSQGESCWTRAASTFAFTASDVVERYLHRGAFEPTLADEDIELDPGRWCSHSAWGQEAWQCVAQWVWNLRLELGHQVEPAPLRLTEFAPAIASQQSRMRRVRPQLLPLPGMLHLPQQPPGKLVASRGKTFPSNLIARFGAQQGRSWSLMSGVEKPMAACALCMEPAFASAALVRCVSSANGMAAKPRSPAK